MQKKWVTIGVLTVLVLGGGYGAYKYLLKPKPVATSLITAEVQRGNVEQDITATGTVNFPNLIPLSFQQGGKLVALNIAAGDQVKKGQVLAQLDTTDLQTAVQNSQANLASAEAKLQQTIDGADSTVLSSLSQAEQEVSTAQQSLTGARQNADPAYLANQVALAKQNVQAQSDAVAQAEQSGDAAKIASAQQALNQAQTALQNAENAQNGGAAQALAAAQATYNSAQSDLAAAQAQQTSEKDGTDPDILAAQAAVTQAQASLSADQTNLANATLTAPDDGVITTVSAQNGEMVGTGSIMTLAAGQPNQLQVDASIDQADIDQVKAGQKADISLDSLPNTIISGTVSQIALQGTTTQNVTTYDVTITLDAPTTILHAGMNANVSIIVAQAQNVLVVPSAAIRGSGANTGVLVPVTAQSSGNASQSSSGQGYQGYRGQGGGGNGNANGNTNGNGSGQFAGRSGNRNSLTGTNTRFVPVQVGLNDGTNAEIISGLTEGQVVVVGIRQATAAGSTGSGSNASRGGMSILGGGAMRGALGGGGGKG